MIKNLEFISKNFKADKIKVEGKFFDIKSADTGRVVAVDGGSAVIIDGGTWALSKLRSASIEYNKSKKAERKDDYYFTIIKDKNYQSFINPEVKLSNDWSSIRELIEAPSVVMKALEFKAAYLLVNQKPDLLLMDSLLFAENKDQDYWLKELEVKSKGDGVNVVGLSKTCRLGLGGQSIIGSLLRAKPNGRWYYPVDDNSFIVKLHDKASYCYMINLFNHSINDLGKILSLLAYYANDAELLGYPYPLLKADKLARINEYERRRELTKLRVLLRKNNLEGIEKDERSTDMHSRLDSLFWRR